MSDDEQPSRSGKTGSAGRAALWAILLLAVALIAAKTRLVGWPEWRLRPAWDWLIYLGTVASADLAFVIGCAVATAMIFMVVRRWPRARRAVGVAAAVFAIVCCIYSVFNEPIFTFSRSPLTHWMVLVCGGYRELPGHAIRLASAGTWLAAGLVAIIFPALVYLLSRQVAPAGTRARQITLAVIAVAAIIIAASGQCAIRSGRWQAWRDEPRIAWNPQWTLIHSIATMPSLAAPSCQSDFPRPVSPRLHRLATPDLQRGPRNIILVVLESVSTQFMSLYGSPYRTTPRLEAEAEHALVFRNFYAPTTNSGNSLVNMMLSQWAPLGWREHIIDHPDMPGVALSAVLKECGYRTAMISSCDFSYANCMGFLRGRGFDLLKDCDALAGKRTAWWGVDDRLMIDESLKWIGGTRERPFFLFCWTQGTHHPFDPAPGQEVIDFLGKDTSWRRMTEDLSKFLNAVHYTDEQLGRLFDGLRQRGLAEDTLVVIVGDHGIAFGRPHENYGHTGKLYQEDVNVPLVLWSPGLYKSRPLSEAVVGMIDIPPTILDLLGFASPPGWQGQSLFSPTHPGRAYFYGSLEGYALGVRQGRYKYMINLTDGWERVFDTVADPSELWEQHETAIGRELRGRVKAWISGELR